MVCPTGALKMEDRRFQDFSRGLALVTAAFLKKFKSADLLFINVLTSITAYCDCWGMSTPALVPDVGILCSDDIVAVETASLDMIKADQVLPGSLPPGRRLLDTGGHLFERIHGKDPYVMVRYLEELYGGNRHYRLKEVK